jgi:hypothetical protein
LSTFYLSPWGRDLALAEANSRQADPLMAEIQDCLVEDWAKNLMLGRLVT